MGEARVTVDEAVAADLADVVRVHVRSFPQFFLTALGDRFLRVFYEDLSRREQAYLLVARADGQVVGFAGGVLDEDRYFRELFRQRVLAYAMASAPAVLRDPRILARLWRGRRRSAPDAVDSPPSTLLSIGVDPSVQGRGVGQALLTEFERVLRDSGQSRYSLTTEADNNQATIRFYDRFGLSRQQTYESADGLAMIEYVGDCRVEDDPQADR